MNRLETSYAMFSVNLDEALGMRRLGRLAKAYQVLSVSSALCLRLTSPLENLLRAMLRHAKHFGTTPNLAPLDPRNFRCSRNQRTARFNGLFSKVPLTRKSQFLHKISTLTELVLELSTSFAESVDGLAEGTSLHPEKEWETLDACHYDLNTCLREAVVVLKSFYHALPASQLEQFESLLRTSPVGSPSSLPIRARNLVHRRMTLIKGQ
jgi:hypothetical protein